MAEQGPSYRRPLRELRGLLVVTTRELSNGYGVVPRGTRAKIDDKRSGWSLICEPCIACGVQVRISRVGERDVKWSDEGPVRAQW